MFCSEIDISACTQVLSLHRNTGLVHTHYVIVLKLELNVQVMRHGMDGFGLSYSLIVYTL